MSSIQDDYSALRRLHEAANMANDKLQEKNRELMEALIHANQRLINCQAALDINKKIMFDALTMQNEMKDAYSKEIQELRGKLKAQGNGDIH
jgi:hypothetical protein